MPHDPALAAETRGRLVKAQADIRAAEHGLTAPPLLADVLFHSQQAAEKSFKAFLTWQNVPFRKTHSLEEIGEQCLPLDTTLRDAVDAAAPLTEYAWKFRYPGDPGEPTTTEALTALATARACFDAVVTRLPREVRDAAS